MKKLGASKTFDYKDSGVVEQIVKSFQAEGLTVNVAYDAVGDLQKCLDVLKGMGAKEGSGHKLALRPAGCRRCSDYAATRRPWRQGRRNAEGTRNPGWWLCAQARRRRG